MTSNEEAESSEMEDKRQPLRENVHRRHHVVPPAHHVVSKQATYLDYLPYVTASAPEVLYGTTRSSVFEGSTPGDEAGQSVQSSTLTETIRTGFRNPWPSWHKPEVGEYWAGMRWRKSANAGVQQAGEEDKGMQQPLLSQDSISKVGSDDVLLIVEPDFSGVKKGIVQATWLGHATVLVQLPPLNSTHNDKPLRILFDPIFSMRCSPTQTFGPIRSYPPPCPISALPDIDLVIISHSHYDHTSRPCLEELWAAHQEYIRFLVPLGDREWFLNLGIGIGEDRVTELDWWDETWLDQTDGETALDRDQMLRVICTPAQHGSGRYGIDAGRSLWSSWTMEHISNGSTYRIFFGGDTGFQFHSSVPEASTYPTCPAFAEVANYIGMPDLSFLPISVGASMNFVKSYDRFGLVPDIDEGLHAANHMTPQDAVRVAKIMRGAEDKDSNGLVVGSGKAVAIHWGTFVTGPEEVKNSMHDLEAACQERGVSFVRSIDERQKGDDTGQDAGLEFACLNHGQSVYLAMDSDGLSG